MNRLVMSIADVAGVVLLADAGADGWVLYHPGTVTRTVARTVPKTVIIIKWKTRTVQAAAVARRFRARMRAVRSNRGCLFRRCLVTRRAR